jgi:hypothetical protein
MKTFIAIPTRQYADTPEKEPVLFKAENHDSARIKVQNYMDMSYIWDIVERERE